MKVDRNGAPLREGVSVRLLVAAPELLNGLPREDQRAIEWAKKEAELLLVGEDDYGNIELEFADPGGTRHWIFVRPTDVAAII